MSIGVISNPRSRRNRRNPGLARELTYVLGERGELHEPSNLEALQRAALRFRERGIEILCVNGGDGTLHRAITAMARAYGDAPLPRIALLRGGTMNTIASSMGIRGRPGEILDHVVTRYHADQPLAQTSRWTLCVNDAHYGFLFGTGIQAAFLEAYYEGSEPTPLKAAWVLARAALSALVGGPFIRRLAASREQEVVVDGQAWGRRRYLTIGAGTVDDIGLRFRPYYRAPRHPERLHLVGFSCSPVALALSLPRMWRGRDLGRQDILDAVCADVRIVDDAPIGFMIDGDFHREGQELRLTVGPRVDFVVPDL